MQTTEITRDQWVPFLDAFSTQHAGWIVTVEVLGSEIGDQQEASGLPLVGIGADTKDGESRIEIMLGGRPGAHLTHIIGTPRHVWVEQSAEPEQDAVAIESDDTTTILRFHYVPPTRIDRQLPGKP
jgi:hypothetical protein